MGFLWWGNDKKSKSKKLKLILPKYVNKNKLDKFAIILPGGGAAGRWQAGVLIYLSQIGLLQNAKFIAGTSVGGLNTALFAMFGGIIADNEMPSDTNLKKIPLHPYRAAVDVWEEITKNKDIYYGQMGGFFDNIGLGFGFIFGRDSILDAKPLRKTIKNIFGEITIGQLYDFFNTHVIITSLDLNYQHEEFYCSFGENKDMKVSDALARTSAIPGVFSSIEGMDVKNGKINKSWHVDGGVGANNPFIAINKYNTAFPNDPIKKAIIIYCYPDEMVDTGTEFAKPDNRKKYKSFKDVLLRTVSSAMNAQEQMVEMIVEDKVKNYDWDVLALWPSEDPGNPLDFTKTELLQNGYNYAIKNKGYSYKKENLVNIIDFLQK